MTLIQADAFHLPYPDKLFHACVTSPPYWGLRKYAGDQGEEPLGLEATPERHIERMVECFREVRRVLRDDGVVWLNYGDCYYNHRPGKGSGLTKQTIANTDRDQPTDYSPRRAGKFEGIGEGSLMLMPHRLAIALQSDGWIVRNDLVWFKRNPMPESVSGWKWESKSCDCGKQAVEDRIAEKMEATGLDRAHIPGRDFETIPIPDCPKCHGTGKVGEPVLRKSSWRHTRAHEYVFQLVKKMGYFCNQEAVREANADPSRTNYKPGPEAYSEGNVHDDSGRKRRNDGFQAYAEGKICAGRNPRSVLDVPTAPYKGAHYATFPPKLIAPLIRASVPRRCCPECGMAWAPVVEKEYHNQRIGDDEKYKDEAFQTNVTYGRGVVTSKVHAYRPTCECGVMEHKPGIVLDTFGGSGTTGMVAKQLLRRWVVMDISRPYLDEQAKVRTGTGTPSKALDGLPMFEELE